MIMLDEHNKIYGSLGLAEPYIIATKEGEALLLDGAKDNEPFIGLSIYGKSHQNTVAGNQLLDISSAEGYTNRGVTITNNGDGSLTASGTPTIDSGTLFIYMFMDPIVLPDGTYTFTGARWELKKKSGGYTQGPNPTFEFNSEEHESVRFYWAKEVSEYVDGETIWPMLNTGSTSLPWEPYTGGQPSPNPDYPQEIVSVGDDGEIGVNVYGGNLLSAVNEADSDLTTNGVTITNNGDGSFTVTGTPTNTEGTAFLYWIARELVLEEGQYALSSGIACRIDKKDGTLKHVSTSFTFDSETDEFVSIYWQRDTNKYVDGETIWPMLNIGSTALPFEPYKQPQSLIVSTPDGLPGIPVSSGGNYTDENGQQWISDEVDYRRGKYVKRVIKRTFGANENMSQNGEITDGIFSIQVRFIEIENVPGIPGLCDNFSKGVGYVERFSLGYKNIYLWIDVKRFDSENPTIEDAKNWLSQNPVTVYAPLETPIETDLTPEQITAYQSLHTNYPTTTVMNDSDAGMKAIYKQIENGG